MHDKPHLEEVDKLTYLRDALKDGPAKNVVKGLTQTAESYKRLSDVSRIVMIARDSAIASTLIVSCMHQP